MEHADSTIHFKVILIKIILYTLYYICIQDRSSQEGSYIESKLIQKKKNAKVVVGGMTNLGPNVILNFGEFSRKKIILGGQWTKKVALGTWHAPNHYTLFWRVDDRGPSLKLVRPCARGKNKFSHIFLSLSLSQI